MALAGLPLGEDGVGGGAMHKLPLGMGPAAHYLAADSMEDRPRWRRIRSPGWAAL